MKRLALALLLCANAAAGQTYTGVSVGTVNAGVVARIDCRSFGQTVQEGGSLNVKYATPIMCWATRSTVGGVAVNDTDWVPEVFFDWNWDDNSLGTVSRSGLTVDLGKSIGLVAAHAFRPSVFAETCGGGTNSSHTVTLTVTSLIAGARSTGSATVTVCVENPKTTWPNPVAYCNDADCSNDSFVGVVNPGTPTHGGNLTDLATILQACGSGSQRILVEGGVTFSTASTGINVGGNSCLVESYGGSKARLQFTSVSNSATAISASNVACAGYRFNNLTFVGSGSGPRLIGGSSNTGCYVLIDAGTSATVGEEFASFSTVDPPVNDVMSEGYYFLSDYTIHTGLNNSFFVYGRYMAWVGSEISATGEHIIRLPQWDHVVIDAMYLHDQELGKHLLAIRQDCGASGSCPHSASASILTVSRNQLVSDEAVGGSWPVQMCAPGSGNPESTKCYDMEFLRNSFTFNQNGTGVDFFIELASSPPSDAELRRLRFIQNGFQVSAMSGSGDEGVHNTLGHSQKMAFLGNVVLSSDASSGSFGITNAGSAAVDIAKNNVCYARAPATCNIFSGFAESADNQSETADPFDRTAGQPPALDTFTLADLLITNANVAIKGQGVVTGVPSDVEGETSPQSSDEDSGLDDE